MAWLVWPTWLGVACLAIVSYETYRAVLQSKGRSGPLGRWLSRWVWLAVRAVAFRLSRRRRHHLLNTVGPLLLPGLIAGALALLVVGYALLYLPHMPGGFSISPGADAPPALQALYVSGATLTTLGYGDVTPRTNGMRALALTQALAGFALISLSVTYLLAVYGALERKRAIALAFYHQADQGADVAGLLAHHFVGGQFVALDDAARDAARDLQTVLESHLEHPIIHYFHALEVHKSLPRMLFLVLETSAVVRACLPGAYDALRRHPDLRTLEASARNLLDQMVASVQPPRRQTSDGDSFEEGDQRRRRRFDDTRRRLAEAGVQLEPDEHAAWQAYEAHRREWEPALHDFASFSGYDWDEMTGDKGLEQAAAEPEHGR